MFVSKIEAQSDRAVPRSHVLMSATLMTPSGAVLARIRDISVAGAQLWVPSAVRPGCDAILKRGGLWVAAKVVRSHDNSIGLQFYRRLTAEEFNLAFQPRIPAAVA